MSLFGFFNRGTDSPAPSLLTGANFDQRPKLFPSPSPDPSKDPAATLIPELQARAHYYQGNDVFDGLRSMIAYYRTKGFERVDDAIYQDRIDRVIQHSRKILNCTDSTGAVIFYGSALRGKVHPKDFDLAVAVKGVGEYSSVVEESPSGSKSGIFGFTRRPPRERAHSRDTMIRSNANAMNDVETAVDQNVPKTIDGISTHVSYYPTFEPFNKWHQLVYVAPTLYIGLCVLLDFGPILIVRRDSTGNNSDLIFSRGAASFESKLRFDKNNQPVEI